MLLIICCFHIHIDHVLYLNAFYYIYAILSASLRIKYYFKGIFYLTLRTFKLT